MTNIQESEDYALAKPVIKMVRDCIEGEPAVKRERETYLKHPNTIDQTSPEQRKRYDAYLDGAEFDEYPATTLSTMLGQMAEGEIEIDLPEKLAKLEQDIDGDGLSLAGAAEIIYSNLLQVKYHVLVADFKGLTDVPADQITIADVKKQNPRATVKMYNRESLIDWEFSRINGKMQLSMMVLVEESHIRKEDLSREKVKAYLILALDQNGDYYQQKYVERDGNKEADGERNYIKLPSGESLKWIPAEIVIDEEYPAGKLPRSVGFLGPTCARALNRYQVSADYKEALRFFGPTGFSSGWKDNDIEQFKRDNGRDYICWGTGITNILPEGVDIDVKSLGATTESFEKYFAENDKRSRAVGAVINDPSSSANKTATEVRVENKNATAVMTMIVKNTEAALRRVVLYCGMFEGLWGQDDIEANIDSVVVVLPREFGSVTMTQDEINSIVALRNNGLLSRNEAIRKLVAGGFTISDAETLIAELETEQAAMPLPIGAGIAQNEDEEQDIDNSAR